MEIIGATLDQHDHGAGQAVARLDEGAELGAFHQIFIAGHEPAALLVSFPTRNMALHAVLFDDRLDVGFVADFLLAAGGKQKCGGKNGAALQKIGAA